MNMLALGLSAEQIAKRRYSVGGSDANIILSGDPDKIMRLWQEKLGEVEPEDLSQVLPVQMGSFTEPLNRHWYAMTSGNAVTDWGAECRSAEHPFMTCTLDGIVEAESAIFEAKHVSAFSNLDEATQRYMPQLHHNMSVRGLKRAVLSVFVGTLKYESIIVEADPFYTASLIEAEETFWECVRSRTAPGEIKGPVSPATPTKFRTVDMTGNNAWAALAADWLKNQAPAKTFDKASKEIKALMEADVGEASGHGIACKRAKNGNLSIKETK